jgi:hypothetical protein
MSENIKLKYLFLLIGMLMGVTYMLVTGSIKMAISPFGLLSALPWGIAGFAIGAIMDGRRKRK